jgi:integrase
MNHVSIASFSPLELIVETVVFADGERCPMLVETSTRLPLLEPNVWALTTYRRDSAAAMEQALRGVMILLLWCAHRGIDLYDRIRAGVFFASHELDSIEAYAATPKRKIGSSALQTAEAKSTSARPRKHRSNVRFLRRMAPAKSEPTVAQDTKRIRIHYITKYIEWLSDKQIFRNGRVAGDLAEAQELSRQYSEAAQKTIVSLNSRTKGRGEKEPKGLDPNQRSELMRVIDPQCKDNPWNDPFVRLRNQIIVTLMLGPGPRRGETLSAKGNALQVASRLLAIIRNQDDKTDPRRKQPMPKTKERLLLLGPDLLALLIQYMKERGKKPIARKHGFLFV